MFLNLDKQKPDKIAVIDNDGHRISYAELIRNSRDIGNKVEPRSIVFCLCKNTAGSLAGYIGFIEKSAVPVTLSYTIRSEERRVGKEC